MSNSAGSPKIALLGNPNSGKSSLFNYLTGLRQSVSNFPGVTVDKKMGIFDIGQGKSATIFDFPGTYSVYPNSTEEKIVINILTNPSDEHYPDLVIYVADATQLERHLLFATQILDLGFPMIFVLNMVDLIENQQIHLNEKALEEYLNVKVIAISVRSEINLSSLKMAIFDALETPALRTQRSHYHFNDAEKFVSKRVMKQLDIENRYLANVIAHHYLWIDHINDKAKQRIAKVIEHAGYHDLRLQVNETLQRFKDFGPIVQATLKPKRRTQTLTDKIDDIITHRVLGPIIFFAIMFFVFQSIYTWASLPMDWIEQGFTYSGSFLTNYLPNTWFSDLIINGLLAGFGGILVFVPQIAILFFLIALLEESGYMSRAVFMFDNVMQKFGMNGRSMVSLISSGACAIPAIMSTRTISNQKERLITILVSPLISCSARLPVYAILVGFVVPAKHIFGIINLRGLVFMGLYILGILAALLSAMIFKKILKSDSHSFLMIEMPNYKAPIWKNVWLSVKEKVSAFILGAGKIIVVISIVLWFLASYGPSNSMDDVEAKARTESAEIGMDSLDTEHHVASKRIEASYIGHLGKWIEPAIRPLGFDWKIGIAIITSFAAREVFVGTMATIYSIGTEDDGHTLREKMANELRPNSSEKMYNPSTAMSLLVFYVFAMQCMSTLAVTKRETNSWKWPIVQFLFMSILAYIGAFVVYAVMS